MHIHARIWRTLEVDRIARPSDEHTLACDILNASASDILFVTQTELSGLSRITMTVSGRTRPVQDLLLREREAMYALMEEHYRGISRASFERDLSDKDWVVEVVEEGSGTLLGFSTQKLLEITLEDGEVRALFSGDTIVARSQWGSSALLGAWSRLALELMDAHKASELYWFLICQAVRTYRFLPAFFRDFFPRYDTATPGRERMILDALGRQQFSNAYDSNHGIVRVNPSSYVLRPNIMDICSVSRPDPHHQFFVERNPQYAKGDELCCIALLTRTNLTRAGRRVIGIN